MGLCIAMGSLNISMPDELREFVDRRTQQTHHATPTEYIRSLVREDQKRAEQETLEKLMLEGLKSGRPIAVDDVEEYIARKKEITVCETEGKIQRC